MSQPSPAPGWYPDPSNSGRQIYWDGSAWSAPLPDSANSLRSKHIAVAVGVCVLAVVGTMMSMQSASLITGTGALWTGVGVVGVAVAVAFFLGGAIWVRAVACVLLAISLASVLYMESAIDEKRRELTQIFDN